MKMHCVKMMNDEAQQIDVPQKLSILVAHVATDNQPALVKHGTYNITSCFTAHRLLV